MRNVLLLAACVMLSSCGVTELSSLVPDTIVSEAAGGLPYNLKTCASAGSQIAQRLLSAQSNKLSIIHSRIAAVQTSLPPELIGDRVVQAIVQHAGYISTKATVQSHALFAMSIPNSSPGLIETTLDLGVPPEPVTYSDLLQFTRTVANQALRHTASAPENPPGGAVEQGFWLRVKAYYTAYYQGKFIDYFAKSVEQPKASLTIGDAEIATAAGVFVEALLDEILRPTVWQDGDGKYYPGAVANKEGPPTYLAFANIKPVAIPFGLNGCGMNVPKANALGYLAQTFATAASAEASLNVKTLGGISVGLGVLGKLNIGDNNTITTVLQSVLPQIVKRLTVALGAPILEAVDVEPGPSPKRLGARFADLKLSRPVASQAAINQTFSAMFVRSPARAAY